MTIPATRQPFHSTYGGNFVEGYEDEIQAARDVERRSADAKELGLAGTYEVVAGPRSA